MGNYQKALDAYLMYAAQTGDVNKVMGLANNANSFKSIFHKLPIINWKIIHTTPKMTKNQ
ncbi:MAG: hypothetical protein R2807_02205 [Chitinophagales bacterium]